MKKTIKNLKKKHIIIFTVLLIIFLIILTKPGLKKEEKIVRKAVFAGSWYPGTKDELNTAIDSFFANVKQQEINGEVKALIVPHAGYAYSGQVAAAGFKHLNGRYDTVILLGPSHRYALKGASLLDVTHYETPLGEIKLSKKVKNLLKEDIINTIPEAHAQEHSLEIELPFLQKQLGSFELIPIVLGEVNPELLANILIKYIDDKTLIVASSDLSHFHTYDEAVQLDVNCLNAIHKLDINEALKCEMCGYYPVLTLMFIAQQKNWKNEVLMYKNSGDITGDKSSVVGYSSIAFYKEGISEDDKIFLLKLARSTVENYLKDKKVPVLDETKLSDNLLKVQGCFVTLQKNHNLRGCIGHIIPQDKLYKCVIANAVSAAVNDRRFYPVDYNELKDISMDISVLSVPEPLEFSSPDDLLNKLVPYKDGVVLQYNGRGATYLPSVWSKIPEKEAFLSSLCGKSGNNPDCWKKDGLRIDIYHTLEFYEEEFGLH